MKTLVLRLMAGAVYEAGIMDNEKTDMMVNARMIRIDVIEFAFLKTHRNMKGSFVVAVFLFLEPK